MHSATISQFAIESMLCGTDTGIMGRGDTQFQEMFADRIQGDGNFISGWFGYCLGDKVHGIVDKYARGDAIGISENFAAGG